jgi:hypothetical protein
VKAETLEHIVDWIIDKLIVEPWSIPELKAVLASSYEDKIVKLCKSSV